MVKFYGYRKNRQWVATWRSTTGSMLSQGFDTEQEAKVFEQNLHLIAEKERALLKKRKRNQANSQKITVNDHIKINVSAAATRAGSKFRQVSNLAS